MKLWKLLTFVTRMVQDFGNDDHKTWNCEEAFGNFQKLMDKVDLHMIRFLDFERFVER